MKVKIVMCMFVFVSLACTLFGGAVVEMEPINSVSIPPSAESEVIEYKDIVFDSYTVCGCESLHVRSDPDFEAAPVGWIFAGDVVEVRDWSDGWASVAGGWVKAEYLCRK